MKKKQVISTNNAPAALGPYSQAVKYGGLIYVSGQLPIDPATNEMVENDVRLQTKQSLTNIKNILAEAGGTMDDILKVTIYLKNMSDFASVNEIYGTFFTPGDCPTRFCVEVAKLPKDALVEIDAIAIDQNA